MSSRVIPFSPTLVLNFKDEQIQLAHSNGKELWIVKRRCLDLYELQSGGNAEGVKFIHQIHLEHDCILVYSFSLKQYTHFHIFVLAPSSSTVHIASYLQSKGLDYSDRSMVWFVTLLSCTFQVQVWGRWQPFSEHAFISSVPALMVLSISTKLKMGKQQLGSPHYIQYQASILMKSTLAKLSKWTRELAAYSFHVQKACSLSMNMIRKYSMSNCQVWPHSR